MNPGQRVSRELAAEGWDRNQVRPALLAGIRRAQHYPGVAQLRLGSVGAPGPIPVMPVNPRVADNQSAAWATSHRRCEAAGYRREPSAVPRFPQQGLRASTTSSRMTRPGACGVGSQPTLVGSRTSRRSTTLTERQHRGPSAPVLSDAAFTLEAWLPATPVLVCGGHLRTQRWAVRSFRPTPTRFRVDPDRYLGH